MHCFVYKSRRLADTYLYLRARDGFDALPAALRASFGAPEFVLELELTPARRLAREDAARVLANLAREGFHLQLPPPPGVEPRP